MKFFEVSQGNYISYYEFDPMVSIGVVEESFFVNLSNVDFITPKECDKKLGENIFHYCVEFDKMTDEGIINNFILYFDNEQNNVCKNLLEQIKGGKSMAKTSNCTTNMPSTTGNKSGRGRGNCSPKK